jgi:uncharacterized protein (TIGR02145 family)
VHFDAKAYALVEIGTQCWFKENLASDSYRNGDPIPGNLSDVQWSNTSLGAQAIWGEIWAPGFDVGASLATYGRLYNLLAVNDSRGLCPTGYHVPSDEEWMTLEMALGMSSSDAMAYDWRGTDQGTQMKTVSWGGINSSGFSALPGGYRIITGANYNQGYDGLWWSSSPVEGFASYRSLNSGNSNVFRSIFTTRFGLSVRCLRD